MGWSRWSVVPLKIADSSPSPIGSEKHQYRQSGSPPRLRSDKGTRPLGHTLAEQNYRKKKRGLKERRKANYDLPRGALITCQDEEEGRAEVLRTHKEIDGPGMTYFVSCPYRVLVIIVEHNLEAVVRGWSSSTEARIIAPRKKVAGFFRAPNQLNIQYYIQKETNMDQSGSTLW